MRELSICYPEPPQAAVAFVEIRIAARSVKLSDFGRGRVGRRRVNRHAQDRKDESQNSPFFHRNVLLLDSEYPLSLVSSIIHYGYFYL